MSVTYCTILNFQRKFVTVPLLNPIAPDWDSFKRLGKKDLLQKLVRAQEQVSGPGNIYRKSVPYWPAGVPYRRPETLAMVNGGLLSFASPADGIRHIMQHLYAYHGYRFDGKRISEEEKVHRQLFVRNRINICRSSSNSNRMSETESARADSVTDDRRKGRRMKCRRPEALRARRCGRTETPTSTPCHSTAYR
jgi:hypothetical protein